jgi:DNA-binding transcriptional LysR family regulator
MSSLDRNQLVALRAFLEEQSVTRAATRLGITQPAASAQLRRLREALQDQLLVRARTGLTVTPRAQSILPVIRQVLDGLRAILEPAAGDFDPQAWEGRVSIAAVDYVQSVTLPALLRGFAASAPKLSISIRPLFAPDLARQLEGDEVQLALMPPGNAPEGARSRKLFDETFLCAVRRDHPTVTAKLDLETYCQLHHILVAPTRFDFSGVADRELRKVGRTRRVRVSVPSFHLAADLVEQSDDVATLPSRLVMARARSLRAFKPPISLPGFSIAAIWHERTQNDPRLSWLRGELTKTAFAADLAEQKA